MAPPFPAESLWLRLPPLDAVHYVATLPLGTLLLQYYVPGPQGELAEWAALEICLPPFIGGI